MAEDLQLSQGGKSNDEDASGNDDDDIVYCTPEAQSTPPERNRAADDEDGDAAQDGAAESHFEQQYGVPWVHFHHHPITRFPLPVDLDVRLEKWSDKKR